MAVYHHTPSLKHLNSYGLLTFSSLLTAQLLDLCLEGERALTGLHGGCEVPYDLSKFQALC